MPKGAESKTKIISKIMEVYPNAFLYNDDKELRIPCFENGEQLEIKVTLTCAKNCVATAVNDWTDKGSTSAASAIKVPKPVEITDDDRKKVDELLDMLGIPRDQ